MFQFIHVTALYSNAVLVAILPYFTDVAKKLDLPIPTPITQSQVRRFFCDPRAQEVGGWVTLTNGYQFWFEKGHVNMFESPHAYFSLQDPGLISKFRGKIRMTTNEAVVYAARKMAEVTADESVIYKNKLKITLAPKDEGFDIPHCKIQWFNVDADHRTNVVAEFEVNLDAGRIEQFALFGKQFWRSSPDIGIETELLPKPKPRYTGGNRLTPVSANYSNTFIKVVLPQITDYAEKLNLPVSLPLQPNQFRDVQIGLSGGNTILQIILTNGYRFNYDNGYVAGFYAPDCFFTYDWEHSDSLKYEDFLGPLTTPQDELIALAREAVRKLGYPEKMLHMEGEPTLLGGPGNKATHGITRYLYGWGVKDVGMGIPQVTVSVEVDAKTKTVKSLFLSSTNLWRNPPKIDVPPEPIPAPMR